MNSPSYSSIDLQSEDMSPTTPTQIPVSMFASTSAESSPRTSMDTSTDTPLWTPPWTPSRTPSPGREEILSTINNRLFTSAGFQNVALMGLGGIGKTQVALSFAHWVKKTKPDYSVIWLTVTSMADFHSSCQKLVEHLGIQDANHQDPKMLVRHYLETDQSGKWLLVLDSFDDASLFYAIPTQDRICHFLPQSENGRVLLTTRSKTVACVAVRSRASTIKLDEMTPEESATLFLRSPNINAQVHTSDLINDLVKELGHIPLAIMQAADYMSARNMSISEYLQLFRGRETDRITLLEYSHVDETYHSPSQGAVATAWRSTLEQIRKESADAVALLEFIAQIDSKSIPKSIFPQFETELDMIEATGMLLQHSFLSKLKAPGLFDMPILVHCVVQQWCKSLGNSEKQRLAVLEHIVRVFPDVRRKDPELWQQYLPHARHVVKRDKAISRDACTLESRIAQCLLEDGKTGEAAGIS
ncbi:putative disease resistance RPP8-like protein 4 [Ceratocystis lukuohia]|uniref:Disease resistance RPP8-like protein 4 n=1 Tax=Ceratocystis lukuohia TaxID=2019550 RepID=A0ABR4M966_9PEZI